MSRTLLAQAVALATAGAGLALPSLAQADVINDSKATLELRNFYFNRDLRHSAPGSERAARLHLALSLSPLLSTASKLLGDKVMNEAQKVLLAS